MQQLLKNMCRTAMIVIMMICEGMVNTANAQCSVLVPPSYSNTCTNQYFTSITASGSSGVVSTISTSGSSCVTSYYDHYATEGITAPAGATVNINFTRFTTTYTGYLWVYIDWNNNSTYDLTELAGAMMTLPAPVLTSTYTFNVPTSGIVAGTNLHMRVMLSEVSSGAPCSANWGETHDFYINVPCIGPAPITGPTDVCEGATIALSDADPGGTWTSSNPVAATVDPATGVVYGVAAGNTMINYTVLGGCVATYNVAVNTAPALIAGTPAVCNGVTTQLSNSVAGGVWSSDNTSVATVSGLGTVSGASSGSANISYTIGSCYAVLPVTVATVAAITGGTNVCAGTTLALSNSTPGGVWSSAGVSAATVDAATGVVYGVASGSAAIYYTVGSCYVYVMVTVGSAVGAITGPTSVCVGATIGLSNSMPGGVWTSSNTSVASVSASGVVKGVAQGSVTVSYALGGCATQTSITVLPSSAGTISGTDSLCAGPGHEMHLTNNVSGGVWSSTNTNKATVDPASGVVTGISTGIDTIKYTITNSCGTFMVKKWIYIRTITKCATGIDEAAVVAGLKVAPNPNGGIFTISLVADINEEAHVVITTISGAVVKEFTMVSNKTIPVDISQLAQGMYLLSVHTAHGNYVEKVVVY